MIDEFRGLAQVLQKQILIRLAGSGVGIVMVIRRRSMSLLRLSDSSMSTRTTD